MVRLILILFLCFSAYACGNKTTQTVNVSTSITKNTNAEKPPIICGACHTEDYFSIIAGKNIAIVANQSSLCDKTHLLDTLIGAGIKVVKVFCPEHGFRGDADAGAIISNDIDVKTGIPIISLYGSNKKPLPEQLQNIDNILFDLQDVGARFYTYISSLHYVMEACAEQGIKLIILDRPNPNGYYIDGPVLDTAYRSFIGMHPVPVVHGMSIGEYALMINGEGWLKDNIKCDLEIILCSGWNHSISYDLPVRPSPNLPNYRSIQLYPSLCLLEGTAISIGRGTNKQFQLIGHPEYNNWDSARYIFRPMPNYGAQNPKLNGQTCYGFDLSESCAIFKCDTSKLNIDFLINCYNHYPFKEQFFTSSFELLSGGTELKKQIINGVSGDEIRKSWEPQLTEFKETRKKYLLYSLK
jgi:uncharacterized protein YbbC (DUF1343 family)